MPANGRRIVVAVVAVVAVVDVVVDDDIVAIDWDGRQQRRTQQLGAVAFTFDLDPDPSSSLQWNWMHGCWGSLRRG